MTGERWLRKAEAKVRSHRVLLDFIAGIGVTLYSPVGVFSLGIVLVPVWGWIALDGYMTRRHERKIAEMIAEEERALGPGIPVEESILALPPEEADALEAALKAAADADVPQPEQEGPLADLLLRFGKSTSTRRG